MPQPISYVICAASGRAVPVQTDDPPEKTLAPASIVAIGHLLENPELDWAKACRIRIPPGEQYVWLLITEENQEKFSDSEFDFDHGAVFASDEAKARASDTIVEVEGEIEKQLHGGTEDACVPRESLNDEDVQNMLESLKHSSTHHNEQKSIRDTGGIPPEEGSAL